MNSNFKFTNELKVLFNNSEVGKLKLENNKVYFEYHKQWIKDGFTISPFKLPLKEGVFVFEQNLQEIWGVFNDCLPDGWGIRLNIQKCAKHNINYEKLTILEKLSLTDKFGLGGLTFMPTNKINEMIEINLEAIVDDVMKNYQNISDLEFVDQIYQQANSSGGARPKIHFNDNQDNSNWIIKFPTSKETKDVGIKEYNANVIAKKCGININECKLIKLNSGIELFAAKRFDIVDNKKIHTISIAGLLDIDFKNSTIDYSTIFEIINLISVDKQNDFYELFKRMVFNYKFGNCDDHTKNFAFIYDDKLKGYKLSPSFDTTKTPELKYHNLLCNNKDFPTNNDFLEIAKNFKLNIETCKEIILKIEKIISESNFIF